MSNREGLKSGVFHNAEYINRFTSEKSSRSLMQQYVKAKNNPNILKNNPAAVSKAEELLKLEYSPDLMLNLERKELEVLCGDLDIALVLGAMYQLEDSTKKN